MTVEVSDPEAIKAHYLNRFRENRAAILEAASLGFDPPIKGCPGWDVAALTGHMGRVYTFWLKWVTERPRPASREAWKELLLERDKRLPGYVAWESAGFPQDARPVGIIEFARSTGDQLDGELNGLAPDDEIWTFVQAQQNGAFVFRRLCMETTIHRWDIEEAHGIDKEIEPELARDGIGEMLAMLRGDPAYEENRANRKGQKVLLKESNGDSHWLVTFGETIETALADGPADVALTGSASDLWLYVMGRKTPEELAVEGDAYIAKSWGDLAGRF